MRKVAAARRRGRRPRRLRGASPRPTRSPRSTAPGSSRQRRLRAGAVRPRRRRRRHRRVAGRCAARPRPSGVGRLFDDGDDTVLALNTALMQGGVGGHGRGRRPAGDRPIEIVHLTAGDAPVSVCTRDVVDVGENAAVRFIESHRGPAGVAYQVNVAHRARRRRWRRGDLGPAPGRERDGAASRELRHAARGARRRSITCGQRRRGAVALAGVSSRSPASGRGSPFTAPTMLSGRSTATRRWSSTTPSRTARAANCSRASIDGRATGAFQGKIIVAPGAQKTDAKMMSQALLLSDDAQFAVEAGTRDLRRRRAVRPRRDLRPDRRGAALLPDGARHPARRGRAAADRGVPRRRHRRDRRRGDRRCAEARGVGRGWQRRGAAG